MDFNWTSIIHLGILFTALLAATYIRAKVPFFQKFLIPNSLTAGFMLLFFYNAVAPAFHLNTEILGEYVYHLLNISFIGMVLRRMKKPEGEVKSGIFPTSVGIVSQYAVQCVAGLLLTYVLINTVFPDLFPALGYLLPMGFALGPGQAFAIGSGWHHMGFEGAGSVGLTFAAVGFVSGCFGGVFLINWGLNKGWISKEEVKKIRSKGVKSGIFPEKSRLPVAAKSTTESEAIDSLTFHIAIVFMVYFLSFGLLHLLTFLLSFAGELGMELAANLWGINFIFSAMTAMAVKHLMGVLKIHYVVDNGTLTRISGFAVDLMVTASIAAISLVVVTQYWIPILVLSAAGVTLAFITLPWICSRMFTDHQFLRTLILFGAATGTMPTGLALLRVVDPDFETPVAADYMYAAGIVFLIAIPLILSINLPAYSVVYNQPMLFWFAVLISLGYLVYVFIAYVIVSKKRSFAQFGKTWYSGDQEE